MPAVPADIVLDQLRWRYATKKFDPSRKIAPDVWQKLEEALVLAPSSYGLQPWKFVVVNDPDVRAKLRPASWGQPQITDASHLVVFATKTDMSPADADRLVRRAAEVRGVPVGTFDGYKGMMAGSINKQTPEQLEHWCTKQVYIALGVFLSAAAMVGVDACPMEGIEAPKYDEILGLTAKGYSARCVATAGYRSAADDLAAAPKVRYAAAEVIEHV